MDSNFRFPDAPSGRSAEARTFSSDGEFTPLAWRDRDFEPPAPSRWISALERGRFQGHKQKRKLKSVAPFARNRKFESVFLQQRVRREPVRWHGPGHFQQAEEPLQVLPEPAGMQRDRWWWSAGCVFGRHSAGC